MTCYGTQLTPQKLEDFLTHVFLENEKREGPGTPICIWGSHGLGKTHIAKAFAQKRGWQFRDIPVAQFEEMGDLHGMPEKVDPTPEKPDSGDEFTYFFPPDWVPKEDGPGLILLDDFNRADDRILRGIMQLLQNFALTSWKLPPKWQIVATANPEGGDYSVTPLDDAMLTRMLHVTLTFEPKEWAKWAISAGIDKRGISFILNRPETVTFKRTTPRTLEQFFRQIENIEDLEKEIELVQTLAMGALDDITVGDFMNFVKEDLAELLEPEEILGSNDFPVIEKRLDDLGTDQKGQKRMDRLSTICTRLFIHITSDTYEPSTEEIENLCLFLKSNKLPKDLVHGLARDISREASNQIREMIRKDHSVAQMIMSSM